MPTKKEKKPKIAKKTKQKQKQKQTQIVNVNIDSTKKQPKKGIKKESKKESVIKPSQNIIVNVSSPSNPVRETVQEFKQNGNHNNPLVPVPVPKVVPVVETPDLINFDEPIPEQPVEEPILSFADIHKGNESLDNFSDINKSDNGFNTDDEKFKKIDNAIDNITERRPELTDENDDDIDDNIYFQPPIIQFTYDNATVEMLMNGDFGLTNTGRVRQKPTLYQLKQMPLELKEKYNK